MPKSQLPLTDDELLNYHDALHWSYQDIAKEYGVNHNLVRMRVRGARLKRITQPPDDSPEYAYKTTEELITIGEQIRDHMQRVDPVYTDLELRFSGKRPLVVALTGCYQSGGRWTRDRLARDFLDDSMKRGLKIVNLGDEIEGFLSGTFAGAQSQHEQALPLPLQKELFTRYLDITKGAVLCGMSSQHGGQWFDKNSGFNPLKEEYKKRGIPYFDATGYLKINVGKQSYNVVVSHELPGSSMINPVHAQRRALWQRFPNADVVAMADRHQFAILQMQVYGNEVEAGNRENSDVWMVQVGTAKTGPDRYTMRGWERGQFGWPYMILWPNDHRVYVTRDYDIVEKCLED